MNTKKDQRLMVDNLVLDKIIEYANPSPEDVILEIGAGNGHLTVELADDAGKVYAIEKDPELINVLKDRVKGTDNVIVLEGDALKMDLPECTKIVSNLPYSISKKITVRLLEHGFKEAYLLFQKEYALKLQAQVGSEKYRFISALTQSVCSIELLMDVSPEAFRPQPNVDSTLVKLTLNKLPSREYIDFLNNLFNHKNKNLSNILENPPVDFKERKPVEINPVELTVLWDLYKGNTQ